MLINILFVIIRSREINDANKFAFPELKHIIIFQLSHQIDPIWTYRQKSRLILTISATLPNCTWLYRSRTQVA